MSDRSFARPVPRVLGGILLLAALFLSTFPRPLSAAPLSPQEGGYWQYVETINNANDQAVDPVYTSEHWSPQFGEWSVSGEHTFGMTPLTTSGSCSWSFETDGGLDRLRPGAVVIVHVDVSYSGVDPNTSGNELRASTCFDQAGVMGAGLHQSATCAKDSITIPGPGGSDTKALEIEIPPGPLFDSNRGALEVNCCPNCYATMSVQRVYEWVEGTAPTGVVAPTAAGTSSDCEAVYLRYSPDPPVPGDTVFLDAGVPSAVSSSPGFSARWETGDGVLPGPLIDNWDGCSEDVKYVYTCNGTNYVAQMNLPGDPCLENAGWTGVVGYGAAGLAAVAAAAAAAAVGLRRVRANRKSKGPEEYILQVTTDDVTLCAGQSAQVTATVYKVTPEGGYVPAPQAAIRVLVSPAPAGLKVQPAAGAGTLTFAISADKKCPGGSGTVQVQGQASGTGYTSTIRVTVQGGYSVEVQCRDPERIVPAAPGEVWCYARVVPAVAMPQPDVDKLTATIKFDTEGPNAAAVQPRDKQPSGSWLAVRLFQEPAKVSGPGAPALVATATIDGNAVVGRLPLSLNRPVVLAAWVQGAKEGTITYHAGARMWEVPDIDLYFHEPGDDRRAVKPSFRYGFAPVAVAPALLAGSGPQARPEPDQWVLRLAPAPGVDLAKAAQSGQAAAGITVTVTAVDTDTGKTYSSAVTLRAKRQAELRFSPEQMKLKPGQLADLEIALCEVGDGQATLVTGGRIQVRPARPVPWFQMKPVLGASPLKSQLLLQKTEDAESFDLEVYGDAPGFEPVTQRYPIEIELPYVIQFRDPPYDVDPATGLPGHVRVELMLEPEDTAVAHAIALDVSKDPVEPDNDVSRQIEPRLQGQNTGQIEVNKTRFDDPAQLFNVKFVFPPDSVSMEDEDPELTGWVKVGKEKLECQPPLKLNLDECRLEMLRRDLIKIAQRLDDQGWYVRDKYLGGPTGPVADGIYRYMYSLPWDWTAGWLANKRRGRLCGDYVNETQADVLKAVRRAYGDRARLVKMSINEKSYFQRGVRAAFDKIYEISHTMFKLTTPNRAEYGIDFWEYHLGKVENIGVMMLWARYHSLWMQRLHGDVDPVLSFGESVIQAGTIQRVHRQW